jgi:tRNA threonylcarbamoyladenosine biosynthesis protein TsaB
MRVLAIETSGDLAGIAAADASGTLAEVAFRHRMELSRFLFPRIEETLALAGLAVEDVEAIAVSAGPGSFTGLRIGVTAAKSLAYARGVPLVEVGTLEALAAAHPVPSGTLVCAVLPASGGQLFAALYHAGEAGEGRLEPWAEAMLLDIGDLVKKLAAASLNVMVAGDPGPHREALAAALGPRLSLPARGEAPRASVVARLGRERLLAGEATPFHAAAPRYLRASAAEVRRREAACPGS